MKRLKASLTLLLVLVMVSSMICGCGQQVATGTQGTQAAAAGTEAPEGTAAADASAEGAQPAKEGNSLPLAAEMTTLTMMSPFPQFMSAFMQSYDDVEAFKMAETMTNVHIEFAATTAAMERETFNLMIASGDYPDIVGFPADYYSGGGDKAIKDDILVRLNELIDTSAPNYKKYREANDSVRKNTTTDGGNVVQFSKIFDEDIGLDYGAQIRQDWLTDLGLATPVTYDDFYNVLKAFKEKKGAEEPFILAATCVPNNNCLIGGYGVPGLMSSFPVSSEPFYQVDGKVKFGPVEAGFKEYLTMMNKWYNEGLVSKDFVSKNANIMDPNVEAAILNNKAGLWYNIQATIANLKLKAVDPKFEAAAIADPVKVAGDKIQIMNSSGLTSGGMCISTQCKNPELAVKWLDFWFSDTGAALANYGVEGKTYTVKDGKYEYTDLMVKNPDKMNLNEAQMKYTVSFLPTISVAKKNYVTYSDAQKAAPETWTSNKVNAYDLPLGMSVSTDESAEYSSIYNDIQTYTIEMMTKFIMGREPLSGFDQFAAKVKDMGIDKCIAIKQAALERYNKR